MSIISSKAGIEQACSSRSINSKTLMQEKNQHNSYRSIHICSTFRLEQNQHAATYKAERSQEFIHYRGRQWRWRGPPALWAEWRAQASSSPCGQNHTWLHRRRVRLHFADRISMYICIAILLQHMHVDLWKCQFVIFSNNVKTNSA